MDKSRDTSCARHSPLEAAPNPGKLLGMFFYWNTEAPSHPPLAGSLQLCFARGKQSQFGPFSLCWSLNLPMLQPWLSVTPHCQRASGELLESPWHHPGTLCPALAPGKGDREAKPGPTGGLGCPAAASHLSCPFLLPVFEAHPGCVSQAEGAQCPTFHRLRALPCLCRALPSLPLAGPARSNVASFGTSSKHFIWCGICEHEAGVQPSNSIPTPGQLHPLSVPISAGNVGGDKGSGWVGTRGPCQLHVQRCQPRVTRLAPAVPEGSRGTRSLLNGSLVPAVLAAHVSRPVPGPRGHRCPQAPPHGSPVTHALIRGWDHI